MTIMTKIIFYRVRKSFLSAKEERRTIEHGVTLAKKQCRLDILERSHVHKDQEMNGAYYQLIV